MAEIKIVPMSVELAEEVDGVGMLLRIESYGRTCYKSNPNEDDAPLESAIKFIRMLMKRGHESVLEHEKVTARVICDRGVTHEIVRHRIASYSQESTRYCDYNNKPMEFINPQPHITGGPSISCWMIAMQYAADRYENLRSNGVPPQMARSVLPNSLKTEIVMTMNLREWRHFFRLRTAKAAHPQMRDVANALLKLFKAEIPAVFEDIEGTE